MRDLAKAIVRGAALVSVLPRLTTLRVAQRISPRLGQLAFRSLVQRASRWTGFTGILRRRAIYERVFTSCGRSCAFEYGTLFATPDLRIGDDVYIGGNGNIGHCSIGRDTLLGSNVTVIAGKSQHGIDRLDVPIRLQPGRFEHVAIGEDVWIGNNAVIAADVGDHAVVAAGAVVVKPVPPYAIVGGNPARVLGDRRTRGAKPGVELGTEPEGAVPS